MVFSRNEITKEVDGYTKKNKKKKKGKTWYFLLLLDFRNVRVKPAWYYFHRLQGKLQDDFGNILKQAGKGECSVHNFCLISG